MLNVKTLCFKKPLNSQLLTSRSFKFYIFYYVQLALLIIFLFIFISLSIHSWLDQLSKEFFYCFIFIN
uniref:Uncharacterized protein n=1 Tax=Meloidogyne enterolobii TaxID=390850 RepID=A0A6V7TJE5_MELEN|nr:unnamed protein product [Meloidogyne enterolobii]